MDYKILPKTDTFITTYPKDSNALSILLQHEETFDWLLNSFIQLTSYDNTYLDYYDFYYRNCPILDIQRINKSFILGAYDNLTDFLIEAIEKDYYIYLPVNTKYISEYQSKSDWTHDLFVYGYNKNEKIFYISDNFEYGKYSNSTCTFEEFDRAIRHLPEEDYWFEGFRNCVELLSFNNEERAKLEPYRIKMSIEDYLDSKPTSSWYVNNAMWNEEETRKRTFGITCYNTIFNHVDIAKNQGSFVQGSRQAFHLMWEHKKTMIMRIKYLYEHKLLKGDETISRYMKLKKDADIAISLFLKYKISPMDEYLNRICLLYENIKNTEEDVLHNLLKEF